MPSDTLNITLLQSDIVWEDKQANFAQYESQLASIKERKEVVVLPEMFTTGFSMQPERFAETMEGETIEWMRQMAATYRCIITGSVMIKEEERYYNRLVWMQPNGQYYHYDKRHLFAFANEDQHYTAGEKKLILQVNGWRICPVICYDLRFPVWLRNQEEAYDILIVVANWPARRAHAWRSLLVARAIENMSYVVGVNRVGNDGKEVYHNGNSAVFNPLGEVLWEHTDEVAIKTITLEKSMLAATRAQFPFLKDADTFYIQ